MPRPNEEEFIRKVLQGHEDAISFCSILFYVSQIWDDIVDGDKPVSEQDKHFAFRSLLVDIPRNPFYQQCFFDLIPLFDASITDWLASNTLRGGSERDRQVAYVLRDRVSIILTYCAGIVGGASWKAQVAPIIHRHVFEEPYEQYRQEAPAQVPGFEVVQDPALPQTGILRDNFRTWPAPVPVQPQPAPVVQPQTHTAGPYYAHQPQQQFAQPAPAPNAEPETVNGYTNYRAFRPMNPEQQRILQQRVAMIDASGNPYEAGVDVETIRSMPLENVEL